MSTKVKKSPQPDSGRQQQKAAIITRSKGKPITTRAKKVKESKAQAERKMMMQEGRTQRSQSKEGESKARSRSQAAEHSVEKKNIHSSTKVAARRTQRPKSKAVKQSSQRSSKSPTPTLKPKMKPQAEPEPTQPVASIPAVSSISPEPNRKKRVRVQDMIQDEELEQLLANDEEPYLLAPSEDVLRLRSAIKGQRLPTRQRAPRRPPSSEEEEDIPAIPIRSKVRQDVASELRKLEEPVSNLEVVKRFMMDGGTARLLIRLKHGEEKEVDFDEGLKMDAFKVAKFMLSLYE